MTLRALALALALLAGCVAPGFRASPEALLAGPLAQDHDHADPFAHAAVSGFEVLAFVDVLGPDLGPTVPADVAVANGVMVVATLGARGGFAVVDASDVTALRVVGRYEVGATYSYYVELTPDARWAFLTARGEPSLAGPPATRALHVVDLEDPTSPRLHRLVPVPPAGPLNVHLDAERSLLYVSVHSGATGAAKPLVSGTPAKQAAPRVLILDFDNVTGDVRPVGEFSVRAPDPLADYFPHDVDTVTLGDGPVGRQVMGAAWWDGGVRLVDVEDPSAPVEVAAWDAPSPGGFRQFHTVRFLDATFRGPDADERGAARARQYAVVSPELFSSPESGWLRVLDVSDVAAPVEVSAWTLPGGLANTVPLLFSPHDVTERDGVVFAAFFHGGAWAFRLERDRDAPPGERHLAPVAWFFPAHPEGRFRASENAPAAPWVETVLAADDGLVYASDMASGVWALRLAR